MPRILAADWLSALRQVRSSFGEPLVTKFDPDQSDPDAFAIR
jgi:hypothetical protein